jgi:hypothetical protein
LIRARAKSHRGDGSSGGILHYHQPLCRKGIREGILGPGHGREPRHQRWSSIQTMEFPFQEKAGV